MYPGGMAAPRGKVLTELRIWLFPLSILLGAALAVFVLAIAVAACGETKDDDDTSGGGGATAADTSGGSGANPDAEIKKGIETVSMPKQLGNPYEEIEHGGVDLALKDAGGTNRIVGPTDAGASSQVPLINSTIQQKPDAIIIAGNDPNAVAPAPVPQASVIPAPRSNTTSSSEPSLLGLRSSTFTR